MTAQVARRIAVCDFWYVSALADLADPLDERSPRTARRPRLRRLSSALALARRSGRYEVAVPNWYEYGIVFLVLALLFRRRNVVILEFIDFSANRGGLVGKLYALLIRPVLSICLRYAVRGIQVMTEWEADAIARRYAYPRNDICVIRWPLLGWTLPTEAAPTTRREGVFSSGRTACDWETLFAAFAMGRWPLTVACTTADRARVDALNAEGRARILTDVPLAAHDAALATCEVYALCLTEKAKSSGQVRLATCVELGVPVVASGVHGLDGYLLDGVTGILVPPGDPARLNRAIEGLLADREHATALAERARRHASGYTRADYFRRVGEFLTSKACGTPAVAIARRGYSGG